MIVADASIVVSALLSSSGSGPSLASGFVKILTCMCHTYSTWRSPLRCADESASARPTPK